MTPDKGLPLVGKALTAKSQDKSFGGFFIKSVDLYENEHPGDAVDINFYYFKVTVKFPNDRGRPDEEKTVSISWEKTGIPEGMSEDIFTQTTGQTFDNLIEGAFLAVQEELITDDIRRQ
ncbi:hypothetical protein [Larkinella arboricola]